MAGRNDCRRYVHKGIFIIVLGLVSSSVRLRPFPTRFDF